MKKTEKECEENREELNSYYSELNGKKENRLDHCTECEILDKNVLRIESPFDAPFLNTAYDGNGGFIATGSGTDSYWEAGIGTPAGYSTVTNWIPAFVAKDGAWTPSIYANANWISFYDDTDQGSNSVDAYFRIRFYLNSSFDASEFFLNMKFFADNAVHEIYVNGVAQSTYSPTVLPQGGTSPYNYRGFDLGKEVDITLENDWQPCLNEIIVHVKSGTPKVGFLAQNSTECYEADIPDYKPNLNIRWGDSDCDCIESNDYEIMTLTACNPYSNITFSNYSVGEIEVCHENGRKVKALPNGDPSVQVVPKGPFCFGDLEPCSCITREFVIINNGAKSGRYKFKVSGICYDVSLHYHQEDCFEFTICKD